MAVKIQRVNPLERREALVDYFLRLQAWPYATRAEYLRYWDWRYTSISESDSTAWIALDGDRIIGHIACNFRTLRCDGRRVRAAVPGNYLVDDAYHNTMVGVQLANSLMRLAKRDEIDLLLGFGNRAAHALFVGLGCVEIGAMLPHVEVLQWGPILARRLPVASVLAPAVNAAGAAWRQFRRGRRARASVRVRDLTAEDLLALDRSHWLEPAGLAWDGSLGYIARRFLTCPVRSYRVIGITEGETGRLEGLVVVEGSARLNVVQCLVNEATLTDVSAVELAVDASPAAEVALVPLLPGSALAGQFAAAGFVRRSRANADPVLQNTTWSAYWRPDHPLAARFADTRCWKLWYGWSHH